VLNDVQVDAFEVLRRSSRAAGNRSSITIRWLDRGHQQVLEQHDRHRLVEHGSTSNVGPSPEPRSAWRGYRGPDSGTARVYVDGTFAGGDRSYSPTYHVQDAVFTTAGLSDASHTLAIEATGSRTLPSSGAQIVVDAFDVATLEHASRSRTGPSRYSAIGFETTAIET